MLYPLECPGIQEYKIWPLVYVSYILGLAMIPCSLEYRMPPNSLSQTLLTCDPRSENYFFFLIHSFCSEKESYLPKPDAPNKYY